MTHITSKLLDMSPRKSQLSHFRALALATVLSLAFTPMFAQEKATGGGEVVLLELLATERMYLGKLDSCELTYYLAYEDYIYRNGAITVLRGSMMFAGFVNATDKGPAYIFKVTAFDLTDEALDLVPLKYAYLSSGGVSYAGKEFVVGAAEDGGLLVGYDALANFTLSFMGPISLNITKVGGSSDVAVPVDFMMHNSDISNQYLECSLKLLDILSEKFK